MPCGESELPPKEKGEGGKHGVRGVLLFLKCVNVFCEGFLIGHYR